MTITVLQGESRYCVEAHPGETVYEAIVRHGSLPLHGPCGGKGTCQKCSVFRLTSEGEVACLACRTLAEADMVLRIPENSRLWVEKDAAVTADFPVDGGMTGWGIACDIGTTTVVCQLIDLTDGRRVSALGRENDQRSYGADVISRIKASMDGNLEAMTAAIRNQLSGMILELAKEAGISVAEIRAMVVAANTTMCHLVAGLPPDSMGTAPYKPLSTFGEWMTAEALQLPFNGKVYLAPAVSGYVGGDITADILAAGLDRSSVPTLLIDVGTNGEMALGCGDDFLCCSTAAGPAFEGAQIRWGMTAAPGAISAVAWKDGQVVCEVLGDVEAKGICGSGLIDAVAMLLDIGALDETGRLLDEDEDDVPDCLLPHLCHEEGEPAFRLVGEITVTQSDIRKLQLGKGAVAAGVQVLRQMYPEKDIGGLLLAGGFGSYIRPESAARIGLIPEDLLDKTRAIGNAAALGAHMALVSREARGRLAEIQKNMRYQELSGMGQFNSAYIEMMMFPEVDRSDRACPV